ncbi:MAG: methionine--tRNA ligase subunit beta [Candidatus Micrarchaeia archaeon]
MVTIKEFMQIDIRIGRIVEVGPHEKAKKPMYKLKVDLGKELGVRQIIAGIAGKYKKEELEGKLIAVVTNLEPKEIAGELSNGMLLAAEDENETLSLLVPDKEIKEGSIVH